MPPAEGDYYVCYNVFTAGDPENPPPATCSIPVFKEGVTTLPSGVQYKVVKAGTGKKPKETDTVVTHYKGTLLDGTEFDSSFKRNQPATFKVNGVIRGWTEALQLMEEGAKWILYVPAALAYGDRGAGQQIGPNATLIFEVELISIEKPEK
jgi:FKBP-type peptidyl-prolyl cis-trans isomerase FklB